MTLLGFVDAIAGMGSLQQLDQFLTLTLVFDEQRQQ